jgi:2-polyprenyl-3-methyl-5-hydroxy-6-metoxy-1,4-benzoquinol methylase
MSSVASAALVLVGLFVLFVLAWRYGARLVRLPCPAWLGWTVERDNPFTRSTQAQAIIRCAGIRPGMQVLDVGCGPGRVAVPAALAVGPQGVVLALDLQPAMLRRARARAEAAGVHNMEFLQAGIGEGKLQQARFDRAILSTVLGEIPDRRAALREIFEALKPGGVLAISEVIYDPHFQRRAALLQLALPLGFREAGFFGNWSAFTLNLEKPA